MLLALRVTLSVLLEKVESSKSSNGKFSSAPMLLSPVNVTDLMPGAETVNCLAGRSARLKTCSSRTTATWLPLVS